MSKLIGKLFLKQSDFDKISDFGLKIKYLKSSDSFVFFGFRPSLADFQNVPGISPFRIVLSRASVCALIDTDKNHDLIYQWSFGYKTPIKNSNLNELIHKELPLVNIPVDELLDFSAWQYVFKISRDSLSQASLLWKRKKWKRLSSPSDVWLSIPLRSHTKVPGSGRSINSKPSWPFPGESLEQVLERCQRNKLIAAQRNFFPWFLDASKDEAKAKNIPFDFDSCLVSWKELVLSLS